jgi:hypothetical protein
MRLGTVATISSVAENCTPDNGRAGLAWTARVGELAGWALATLVNRLDVWGGYRPLEEVGREFTRRDGSKGVLGEQRTVYGRVTDYLLARHFRARDRSAVIGFHTAGADNFSKGGALDIDHHGPTSTAAEVNLRAALHWYAALVRLGFRPLLLDSNGRGGFHLRLLLAEAVPADRLFYFLRSLTGDHARLGFPRPPEQFPKQADVRRCHKGLGNWLRAPGKHHKHDHWSRAWNGARWLEGHDAIDFLLALTGDPPGLLPPPPPPAPPPTPRRVRYPAGRGGNLGERIAAYLRRLPHLGEGQGRDDVAFHFAAFLVRDLALSDDTALGWLGLWDEGNRPPKGRERLAEILRNAKQYGQRPVGCGLGRQSEGRGSKVQVIPTGRPGHYILRSVVEVR